LGQGTHVVCPTDADAGDEEETGTDALAVAVTDSDAALAPDNDVMASTPMAAATIPERAITERRLNLIIFQPPSACQPNTPMDPCDHLFGNAKSGTLYLACCQ
jgi:hypothetical protein